MPIYEYHCSECKKDVSILFLSFSEADEKEPVCPECGNEKIERLLSSVTLIHKKTNSTKSKFPKDITVNEEPKSLAKTMHKASNKSRANYGNEFKEVANRLDKGESSTSIEKSLRKKVGESMQTH